MIRVTEVQNTDLNMKSCRVSLFADTKSEVVPGAQIVGMPVDSTIEMGSSVMTASGELAFMKSDGTWNWV